MERCFILCILVVGITARNHSTKVPVVEPEYLDELLRNGSFSEFSFLMGIKNSSFVDPHSVNHTDFPLMHEGLEFGDFMLAPEEEEDEEVEGRQGIRFDKYKGSKWSNRVVPYVISNSYSWRAKQEIHNAVQEWNSKVRCVKFVHRKQEAAYVMFFSGGGCYSVLGRTGRQQPISIRDPGCVYRGVILHEMVHAVGFTHEQNRSDRDNHIRILWQNIPERWKSQYRKTNPNDYGLQRRYDYYSLMHYSIYAPGTNKKAFDVLERNINPNFIGNKGTFSATDINRINDLYC